MANIIIDDFNSIDLNSNLLKLNPSLPLSIKTLAFQITQNHKIHNEPLVWIMSSGTTTSNQSQFKLIGLSHASLLESAQTVNKHLKVNSSDRWLNILPLFHVGGLGILYRSYLSKSECFNFWNEDYKWNPYHFAEQCHLLGASLSSLVPTQIYDIIKENIYAPQSLRAIIVGGAQLNFDLYSKALLLGWPLIPSFGMTEVSSQIATGSIEELSQNLKLIKFNPNEVFIPKLYILNHHQVKTNHDNLLSIKSKSLLKGYYQLMLNETFNWINPIDDDGWYQTSDCVHLKFSKNENLRHIEFLGRSDDVIKINGENVNLSFLRSRLESVLNHYNSPIIKASHFNSLLPENINQKGNSVTSVNSKTNLTIVAKGHPRKGYELYLVGNVLIEIQKKIADLFNEQSLPFEQIKVFPQILEIPCNSLGKINMGLLTEMINGLNIL